MALSDWEMWLTAGDDRVCPYCAPLDGKVFARGAGPAPPAHVFCRCIRVPIDDRGRPVIPPGTPGFPPDRDRDRGWPSIPLPGLPSLPDLDIDLPSIDIPGFDVADIPGAHLLQRVSDAATSRLQRGSDQFAELLNVAAGDPSDKRPRNADGSLLTPAQMIGLGLSLLAARTALADAGERDQPRKRKRRRPP